MGAFGGQGTHLGALAQETMSVRDVETALRHASVIEEYQHLHRHLPDCLVLAQARTQAIHCVVAMNETDGYVLIVTVYQPAPEGWENDWRTRK